MKKLERFEIDRTYSKLPGESKRLRVLSTEGDLLEATFYVLKRTLCIYGKVSFRYVVTCGANNVGTIYAWAPSEPTIKSIEYSFIAGGPEVSEKLIELLRAHTGKAEDFEYRILD